MPSWRTLLSKRFLQKEDIGPGKLVTLKAIELDVNVGTEKEPDPKSIAHFHELDKPLVLGFEKLMDMEGAAGGIEDYAQWIGRPFVLYVDPNVMYLGKRVGGIRVRAPKPGSVPAAAARPPQQATGAGFHGQQRSPSPALASYPPGLALPNEPGGGVADAFPEGPQSGDFDDDVPF